MGLASCQSVVSDGGINSFTLVDPAVDDRTEPTGEHSAR